MVQLVLGDKGKGKTKFLLDTANDSVKTAEGSVIYLDKNAKHMYELNNQIRLVDVSRFAITNYDQFIGFVCGILSQNNDIEKMYFDSFLNLAKVEDSLENTTITINQLEKISDSSNVDFIIGLSLEKEELNETLQKKIVTVL